MRQPLRHIEDTLTSIVALLALGVVGFCGLVVLMLTLALGSRSASRVPVVRMREGFEHESFVLSIQIRFPCLPGLPGG
jgi:hypothetical protein